MSWLQEIVAQHDELESPKSFWYWSALAAISAVVKDQVWLNLQIFNIYPNIYVMLHADSGLKKGPPIAMARQLVKPVNNTRIISGRSSIQGILKDLGTGYTQPGGKVILQSVAFICSSELSSSIVEDKVATKILTDLYDRQYNVGEWRSLLKMETFELKNPTVTMLTATNEAMAEDFFTRSAIQGGYFARTFIIYEKESQNTNSLIYRLQNPPNYSSSSDYLKELAKLQGPFDPLEGDKSSEFRYRKVKKTKLGDRELYFNETGIIFDDWYDQFTEMKKNLEQKDETGTLNRFDNSVLKVAMLLSLAHEPVKKIPPQIMVEAIAECEKLIANVRRTTIGKQGISQSSLLKTLIIMELLNRTPHQISRAMLMKKLWSHYENSAEFDDIMQGFDHSGMIKTDTIGNQIIYTMSAETAEDMRTFLKGKKKI